VRFGRADVGPRFQPEAESRKAAKPPNQKAHGHPTSGFCASISDLYAYAVTADSTRDIAMLVPVIQGYVTASVGIWCTSDGP
jgi:hypothetical protein